MTKYCHYIVNLVGIVPELGVSDLFYGEGEGKFEIYRGIVIQNYLGMHRFTVNLI